MTREELKEHCKKQVEMCEMWAKAKGENPCGKVYEEHKMILELLEQTAKIGYCKDCKWWKDSDGVYRRGVGAESQCLINHKEVYKGKGYCFMFDEKEPREVEFS